jgi:hypothetical protein
MPYGEFYAAVDPLAGSLWRRQMVLGPTPEFGLLSAQQIQVPPRFEALELKLSPIAF